MVEYVRKHFVDLGPLETQIIAPWRDEDTVSDSGEELGLVVTTPRDQGGNLTDNAEASLETDFLKSGGLGSGER